jgi:phage repressor protein C with HTH and peptisase S24 domain
MAPTIKENDIAVIGPDGVPTDDAIFLVASSGKASLRRLQKEQDKLIAQPENDEHSHIEINVRAL